MPDFWTSCGHRLLARAADGRLALTDDFLRAHLERPELAPVAESCAAERALHDALVARPRRAVEGAEVERIADPDARENYRVWLRFRDRLTAADTLEAAYVALFRGTGVDVPPLFVHGLTQVFVRHVLGADGDPLEARMGEMLFRAQRVRLLPDGALMAVDAETVERRAPDGGFGSLGELLRRNRTATRSAELDVLGRENAHVYWERDERFDLAVSLNRGQPGLAAFCRVLEKWVAHFLGTEVRVEPRREIEDARWVWHVGLDAEASAILNDLYDQVEVDDERMGRLIALFVLEFANPSQMLARVAGRPVYLAMAMNARDELRLKPQNLLLNLPLAEPS